MGLAVLMQGVLQFWEPVRAEAALSLQNLTTMVNLSLYNL